MLKSLVAHQASIHKKEKRLRRRATRSMIRHKARKTHEASLGVNKMKKFRNVLIHKYVELDDLLVYQHATQETVDFVKLKKEVLLFLKKKTKLGTAE